MEAYATARKPVVYVNTLERLALRRALRLLTPHGKKVKPSPAYRNTLDGLRSLIDKVEKARQGVRS